MVARLTLVGTLVLVIPWLIAPGKASARRAVLDHASSTKCEIRPSASEATDAPFVLRGLVSPAVVSGAISVAVSGATHGSVVTYCIDAVPAWNTKEEPYALGPLNDRGVGIFSVRHLTDSDHRLQAIMDLPDGRHILSDVISFRPVPETDATFSRGLTAYPVLPTVLQPASLILQHTSTSEPSINPDEKDVRARIVAMYLNFGFDLSFDYVDDLSEILPTLLPSGWALPKRDSNLPWSLHFSPDAPFYQPIPANWPRVPLPKGYIKTIQINTNQQGDGIGYGISVASPQSKTEIIHSIWENQEATRRNTPFLVASDWPASLPRLAAGDRHVIFVDPMQGTLVSLYKASVEPDQHTPHALYASPPVSFNSLGDLGGSTAARFSELPLLIQPGEATTDAGLIRHALGGPVSRVWAARVYPATARDYGMFNSVNTCTGKGRMNTGLVPYGGVIQLDPTLRLDRLPLSRPAFRILKAIQTYGYYVMDFGCADLDIYTAIAEDELSPFGGLYGFPANGPGVEKEVADVLSKSTLYVVPPMTKRP